MTHIIDSPGATSTRCGIKTKDDEALPLVLARFVPMHIAGRDMEICPSCEHHNREEAS